jgi:signal transduction histidine kinase/HD-like signal output (HDOD) protein
MTPAATTLDRARQVEMILERVRTLPTLSPVAARLLSIGTIDEVLIGDVVKIIESDPALSARILGLCRKADRGLGDRITTVKRAVLMLGIEAVRAAALSVSVYDLMTGEDEAAREALDTAVAGDTAPAKRTFDRKGFWKHSIAVACAAELIAQVNPKLRVMPEEAFLAGLLHDVGKLVLDLVLPRSYERVLEVAHRRGCDSSAVERAVLGLDHHTAGKRVTEHWGLPEAIQHVVWMHGQPLAALPEGPDRNLIGAVTVAKAVCRGLHLGWPGDFGQAPDAERLWAELGLKAGGPSHIAGPLHGAIADRLKVLGLDDTTPPGLLLESLSNANRQLSDLNSALQERAVMSHSQARVLEAIDQFHAMSPAARTIAETMGVVAKSAWRAFGAGFYAVLAQGEGEDVWRMVQLDASGDPMAVCLLDAPPERVGGARLSELASGSQLNVAVLGLLPWLSDHLLHASDLRKLRLLPLTGGGPPAILINDRDIAEGLAPGALRAVTATWGAAMAAAAERERTRRLHEQLVESGRAIAEMQARLAEQESMVRLGQTTAGAAHEMNNPLTVIAGHGQLLMSRLENERDKSAARAIAEAAKDLSSMISSLHLLSQTPVAQARPVRMAEVVTRAVANARQKSGKQTTVTQRVEVKEAHLDPDLAAGVLTELVANAMEACPEGPVTVTVAVREGSLVIEVADLGPGLTHKARQHAFDPFFSERPAGRGRGLGLTRAQRMAVAMGGGIALEDGAGGGVRAVLALPEWK